MEKPVRDSFWHFINPVCLAVGIIGFILHFEVEYFAIGITGMFFWGLTGLKAQEIEEKTRISNPTG